MFNSTSNNFGAGVIQFKDVQESNYLVLNARLTVDSSAAAYLAAEELEIYVPDLTIGRSTVCGVVCQYKDRGVSYGSAYVYDAGTVLKSWVKDKNTIVIEKLPEFDNRGELTIWIQAMYCQLNQGGNTVRGTKTRLTFTDPNRYTFWTSDSICVIFQKWVFLHAQIDSVSWDAGDADFEVTVQGLPTDIDAEVPMMMNVSYGNDNLGGVNASKIEAGVWSIKGEDRSMGFRNTSNKPFMFAYLVRDI